MRNKIKGLVAFFLIGLLTIPLALVGVENLFYGSNTVGEVAEVNGKVITEREMQLALGRERQRLQSQFGSNVPTDFLSNERLRQPVLEGLIRRAVIASVAAEGKMTFSDADIDKTIVALPDFQAEGRFDSQRFMQVIRSLGHTPASFRELMREDMIVNQMQSALVSTDFITDDEINQAVALSRQSRDFSWVTLPLGNSAEAIEVADAEITVYYEENKQTYLTEEQVAIEYIQINISDLEKDITIDEELVREQYQQELNNTSSETEREAAHIMIEGDDDAAKEKIALVHEKIAAGEDFAELAKEYSDDFGSRDNGGNLGIVASGDVFPPEFQSALSELVEGGVSEPVSVDNATHFIKLISLNEHTPPTFEAEQTRIEASLKRAQAEEQFIKDVEALNELTYNAETLGEAAQEMGLDVSNTSLFTRSGGQESVLSDSRVVNAAFSERVLLERFSSEVLELSTESVVVVKLIDHKPIRTITLDEKKEDIIAELKLEKAKAQIAEKATVIREALDNGQSLIALSEKQGLALSTQVDAGRNAAGVPQELINHIFEMASPKNEAVTIDERHLENGDYVVISLSKVTEGAIDKLTDEERVSLRTNLGSSVAGDGYRAWQAFLRNEADVEVYSSSSAQHYN